MPMPDAIGRLQPRGALLFRKTLTALLGGISWNCAALFSYMEMWLQNDRATLPIGSAIEIAG
jgi:hypothetical protein